MLEDGMLVTKQSVTRPLKRSHDSQQSTLVLTGARRVVREALSEQSAGHVKS